MRELVQEPLSPSPAPDLEPERKEPPRPPKTRRVGTLTCGIALIFFGAGIGAFLIWPGFDLMLLLRLSPLMLVLLGAELLVASFSRFELRLKYDFASIFLCLLLGITALGLSVFLVVVRWFGPDQQAAQARLTAQTDAAVYQLLKEDPAVLDCRSDVILYTPVLSQSEDQNIQPDRLRLDISLRGPYTEAAAFAEDCARVRDLLLAGDLSPDRITFSWAQGEEDLSLVLDSPFALQETAAQLTERVV